MQIRGTELINKRIKSILEQRDAKKYETNILLLNPNSIFVSSRVDKLKQYDSKSYAADIKSNIRKLENFIQKGNWIIDFCLYSQEPIFNIHLFDEVLYLSFYSDLEVRKGKERQNVPCYKIKNSSLLYESIVKYFDYTWNE